MALQLTRINYDELNSRQKENYNFQKVSAILADYGYVTMRLSDDWEGADFIAQHVTDKTFLKVQLKSRLSFGKKYSDKELYVAFLHARDLYLYEHDELLAQVLAHTGIGETDSWDKRGGYSFPGLSQKMRKLLEPYKVPQHSGPLLPTTADRDAASGNDV